MSPRVYFGVLCPESLQSYFGVAYSATLSNIWHSEKFKTMELVKRSRTFEFLGQQIICMIFVVVVVQPLNRVQIFATPMDCSMPGFPVLHYLLALIRFMSIDGDAIQPSHPLSPLPSPAFNLSQHQGLF